MAKKILRIVTWYNGLNFGTGLQAFALKTALNARGYDARILSVDIECKYDWHFYCWAIERWLGINSLRHRLVDRFIKGIVRHPREITSETWINNHIKPEIFYTRSGWDKALSATYCFISGSDSIWNTYLGYHPELFLSFVDNAKKIAYSSSIGTNHVNPIYAAKVKQHLKSFAHIGVREQTGANALTALTGRTDIVRVMDPVFLLSQEDWQSILQKHDYSLPAASQHPYVLCYLLGKSPRYIDQIEDVVRRTGINAIVNMEAWENQNFSIPGVDSIVKYSPLQFLQTLANADYICTDSFHCTAFSLIFKKQFVTFSRYEEKDPESSNSRVVDLLALFGLSHRHYDSTSPDWTSSIDYNLVSAKLNNERVRSLSYLIESIEH